MRGRVWLGMIASVLVLLYLIALLAGFHVRGALFDSGAPDAAPIIPVPSTPTRPEQPEENQLPKSPPVDRNPIAVENQQPGTDEWQIPWSGARLADDTTNQIKGYTGTPSVAKGGSLNFHVTVSPAQSFTIDIFRLGWYGGLGGRLLQHIGPLSGVQQPACPVVEPATQLLACSWAVSHTLSVPTGWTDGLYLAVLTNANNYQNYIPFTVRDDARSAALLYQQPVNTYQAYNNWGGKSFYGFNSTNSSRAYKVSFDRPYAGDGSGRYFRWEADLVQWLERQGYDVTYTTDVDVHANASRLRSAQGVLVAGHSEYWSQAMYDAAEGARDAGVSLAFFSANDVYWQVRLEPSSGGTAHRVLVCYKTSEAPNPTDPVTATNPALTTTQWRLPPVNRPEQQLIGIQFTSQIDAGSDNVPYVVTNSTHWAYSGTGFSDGTSVPRIVGYEMDRLWSSVSLPAHQSYTVLAHSPYTDVDGQSDAHNAVIYQAPSGAWVFATGTMSWSWALNRPGYVQPGIQRMTANILDRFITEQQ